MDGSLRQSLKDASSALIETERADVPESMRTLLACEAALVLCFDGNKATRHMLVDVVAVKNAYAGKPQKLRVVLEEVERFAHGLKVLQRETVVMLTPRWLLRHFEQILETFGGFSFPLAILLTRTSETVSVTMLDAETFVLFDATKQQPYFMTFVDTNSLARHIVGIFQSEESSDDSESDYSSDETDTIKVCVVRSAGRLDELKTLDVTALQLKTLTESIKMLELMLTDVEESYKRLEVLERRLEKRKRERDFLKKNMSALVLGLERRLEKRKRNFQARRQRKQMEPKQRRSSADQNLAQAVRGAILGDPTPRVPSASDKSATPKETTNCPPENHADSQQQEQVSSSSAFLLIAKSSIQSGSFPSAATDSTVTCAICYGEFAPNALMVTVESCGHVMCWKCATQYLATEIENGKASIQCPQCDAVLSIDLLLLVLSDEEWRHYLKNSFEKGIKDGKEGEVGIACPRPNCEGAAVVGADHHFICPSPECGYHMCSKCRKDWHGEAPCDTSVSNTDFFFRKMNLQRCSKCRAFVEKDKHGCNHITCRCGHEFCYLCGQTVSKVNDGKWNANNHHCQLFEASELVPSDSDSDSSSDC